MMTLVVPVVTWVVTRRLGYHANRYHLLLGGSLCERMKTGIRNSYLGNLQRASQAATIHWPNAVLMLGQRRRRWANINITSDQCRLHWGTTRVNGNKIIYFWFKLCKILSRDIFKPLIFHDRIFIISIIAQLFFFHKIDIQIRSFTVIGQPKSRFLKYVEAQMNYLSDSSCRGWSYVNNSRIKSVDIAAVCQLSCDHGFSTEQTRDVGPTLGQRLAFAG